jgi:uncharacterized RmlC-like cupin family protein
MMRATRWRTDDVKVMRAAALRRAAFGPSGTGRATAFDFAGSGGQKTWIGTVSLQPHAQTGPHHHGRHEVAVYVVKGHGRIRWGERLEFAAEVSSGDFAYFAPYVPHQELNVDGKETLDLVVVRSDNERIVVDLDIAPAEHPVWVENDATTA